MTNKFGYIILFEGMDYTGKSTVAKKIHDFLNESGRECIVVSDYCSTDIGIDVHSILLKNADSDLSDFSKALLISAARYELFTKVIHPAIAANKVVILDRSIFSTSGYQHDQNTETLRMLNSLAIDKTMFDLVIYLSLPYEKYLERLGLRTEKLDALDTHTKEEYNIIKSEMSRELNHYAIDNPQVVYSLDADQPEIHLFNQCLKLVIETINY